MIKHAALAFVVATLFSTSSLAAAQGDFTTSPDKKITYAMTHRGAQVPNYVLRKGAKVVLSSLALDYAKGLYFPFYGATVGGPNSQVGLVETAAAFTLTSDTTITEVDAGVGFVSGVNGVLMSIYSDAGGVPGKSLADFSASGLPTFGTCCELATAKSKKGVALTAGTQYWFVLATSAKQATTWDAANAETTDTVDDSLAAGNEGSGWSSYSTNFLPAFALYAK
jgi:hypothetical protein